MGNKKAEVSRLEQLQMFSQGEITYRVLMDQRNIDSDEALFLEMCAAGLPVPQLPEEETAAMVRLLRELVPTKDGGKKP